MSTGMIVAVALLAFGAGVYYALHVLPWFERRGSVARVVGRIIPTAVWLVTALSLAPLPH